MDGTCLNDKNLISEKCLTALAELSKERIVVPTTGRSLSCLPHQLVDQDFYRYVISSNGAVLSDLKENKKLYQALLANQDVISLLEEVSELKIGVSIHADDEFILQGKVLGLMGRISYGEDVKRTINVKDLSAYLKEKAVDVEEVQLFFFSEKTKHRLQEVLKWHPNIEAAFSENYVELYSHDASKGNALKALAEMLEVKKQDIACIGDSENDLSMFKVAEDSFAMGNAINQLKKEAKYIVATNLEDGVYEAITNYLMK